MLYTCQERRPGGKSREITCERQLGTAGFRRDKPLKSLKKGLALSNFYFKEIALSTGLGTDCHRETIQIWETVVGFHNRLMSSNGGSH